MLRLRDLGSSGWRGGRVKPDLTSGLACRGYVPKQSDLVLTGAAETAWGRTGLQVRSVAQVLKTRAMVARDWERTVADPRAVACLRGAITKGLTSSERLVSFRRLAFPRLATYSTAYRALIDVSVQGTHARVLADLVLVGTEPHGGDADACGSGRCRREHLRCRCPPGARLACASRA